MTRIAASTAANRYYLARKGVRRGQPPCADEAGKSALHTCKRTPGASVKAVQGAILQIVWR